MSVAKEYTASIFRVLYPEDGDSRPVVFLKMLLLIVAGNYKRTKMECPLKVRYFIQIFYLVRKLLGRCADLMVLNKLQFPLNNGMI
jgi:hypothetical protein